MFKLEQEEIEQIQHLLEQNREIVIRKTRDGYKILACSYKKIAEKFDN